MPTPASRKVIRFGVFELDSHAWELRKSGARIKLQQKPIQLLLFLLEHPGELVTREQLHQRLWPSDVNVDIDRSLNSAVAKIRDALGDLAESPRYIETLPRLGYRFIGPTDLPVAGIPWHQRSPFRRRRLLLGVTIVALAAGLVGLSFRKIGGLLGQSSPMASSVPSAIASLAVLPFENLSGDSSKNYFADGFTDALITDLAEQTRIRVVSRSSVMRYQNSRKPLREMARELGVDAIVEGSVFISEQHVRITAQLIEAASDRHLWAHSYERDRTDLLPIQTEVAETIASLILVSTENRNSGDVRAIQSHPRFSAKVYELSLQCRSLAGDYTDAEVNNQINCYQRILTLDPNCAAAYAQIAGDYLALGLENEAKARDTALKAVELDPMLPEAQLMLADFKMSYEKDFVGAEAEFKMTLALDPSYGRAYEDYANLLLVTGRTTEAIAMASRATELAPFSARIGLGTVLFLTGHHDQAIQAEQTALEYYPRNLRAVLVLGYAYEQSHMYKNAIAVYKRNLRNDEHGVLLTALGRSLLLSGDGSGATEVQQKVEHFPVPDFIWPYDAALFYAALGDKDRAFAWLDKDLKRHDDWLLFLNIDPRVAPLRSDPRFSGLVRRVGLPVVAFPRSVSHSESERASAKEPTSE